MAWDLNHCVFIGRLTRDPELRHTSSGDAVCTFSIAVNGLKEDEVAFIPVETWGKSAENSSKFLNKGSQVCVEGSLKQDRWEKDGKKFNALKIRAGRIQFLDTKKQGGDNFQKDVSYNQPEYHNDHFPEGPEFQDDVPY